MLSLLAFFMLAVGGLVAVAPGATAVVNTCRARDLTQDTPVRTNLQRVIDAASYGDKITVKRVCVGNFLIDKKLFLVGVPTPTRSRAVLYGNGATTLVVSSYVRLTNLKITGGATTGDGGGIYNIGSLTLIDTVVTGNTAAYGGGISNGGDEAHYSANLFLKGTSSVTHNTATSDGGGIDNTTFGTFVMNDSSSVTANHADLSGGGIANHHGPMTLKGLSSVNDNTAAAFGGGIYVEGGSVAVQGGASVAANIADSDDTNGGTGGGAYTLCTGTLTGAADGGNIHNNLRGATAPVVDNIANQVCA